MLTKGSLVRLKQTAFYNKEGVVEAEASLSTFALVRINGILVDVRQGEYEILEYVEPTKTQREQLVTVYCEGVHKEQLSPWNPTTWSKEDCIESKEREEAIELFGQNEAFHGWWVSKSEDNIKSVIWYQLTINTDDWLLVGGRDGYHLLIRKNPDTEILEIKEMKK